MKESVLPHGSDAQRLSGVRLHIVWIHVRTAFMLPEESSSRWSDRADSRVEPFMPAPETIHRVKNIIRASLKLEDGIAISDDMALAGGAHDMDSLDILLIVTSMEKEFGFKIDDTKLTKAAFKNVESLATFVDSCAAASNPAHPVDGHER